MYPSRGGTDLERGYGDVRPWRPPFHASPAARKGPISSKWVSSQDPLLRKLGNFGLYSLNFHPNFSSQAPNLEIFSSQAPKFRNFQLTSPQIWKFSAHKTPFSEVNVSSQAPHFGNPCRTPLPEKKLSAPPPRYPFHFITQHVVVSACPCRQTKFWCMLCVILNCINLISLTFNPLISQSLSRWCHHNRTKRKRGEMPEYGTRVLHDYRHVIIGDCVVW